MTPYLKKEELEKLIQDLTDASSESPFNIVPKAVCYRGRIYKVKNGKLEDGTENTY